jgi:hypothetical protein
MSVIQLRSYQLAEGTLPGWAEHWRQHVLPLRQAFGFEIVFAYADHDNSQFVWAVRFDGTAEDLSRRDREYHDSLEWAARNKGKNGPIQSTTVAIVEDLWRATRERAPGVIPPTSAH